MLQLLNILWLSYHRHLTKNFLGKFSENILFEQTVHSIMVVYSPHYFIVWSFHLLIPALCPFMRGCPPPIKGHKAKPKSGKICIWCRILVVMAIERGKTFKPALFWKGFGRYVSGVSLYQDCLNYSFNLLQNMAARGRGSFSYIHNTCIYVYMDD